MQEDGRYDNNGQLQVDEMEAQLGTAQPFSTFQKNKSTEYPAVITETEDEDDDDDNDEEEEKASVHERQHGNGSQNIVVIVDDSDNRPRRLPPLRGPTTKIEIHEPVSDYVDPSLFSPEISRHSYEIAHRRAKALEMELQELASSEEDLPSSSANLTSKEAIGAARELMTRSWTRLRQLVGARSAQYDLLNGGSPVSKMDDFDTDGDGLQISPDGQASSNGAKDAHFRANGVRPVLKRISAYSGIETEREARKAKRSIQWHADVLAEHGDDEEEDDLDAQGEEHTLMSSSGQSTPRRMASPSMMKRKKAKSGGGMRRLTPREKEELYKQRPDLMIIPNWAQKYREEMLEAETTRWSLWLLMIIGGLGVLLVVLIILIIHEKATANRNMIDNKL